MGVQRNNYTYLGKMEHHNSWVMRLKSSVDLPQDCVAELTAFVMLSGKLQHFPFYAEKHVWRVSPKRVHICHRHDCLQRLTPSGSWMCTDRFVSFVGLNLREGNSDRSYNSASIVKSIVNRALHAGTTCVLESVLELLQSTPSWWTDRGRMLEKAWS